MMKRLIDFSYSRRPTVSVQVGKVGIGSNYPIRVQSMANTDTNDIEGSVNQALKMIQAGAELVRFTTQGLRETEALGEIKRRLVQDSKTVPLVADVHFNPHVALRAAELVDKVRINPGNYIDPARKFVLLQYTQEEYQQELNRLNSKFKELLEVCKAHGTALRLGVNHGSLSDRIMSRYGNTAEGMVESCMEFLRVCVKEGFQNVVVSIKASNTFLMVETVLLLVRTMAQEGMHFPLHLGVTEAGDGEDGRIKSAIGIGALLAQGIGDTIRVSLAEPPENELPVAKELVRYFTDPKSERYEKVKCYWDQGIEYESNEQVSYATFALHAAADLGKVLFDTRCTDLTITNPYFSAQQCETLAKDILQAAGLKIYKTQYIACPSCGRTMFDLQETLAQVKAATQQMSGLKIAVMGCIVNGPGEMADADYGYVGAGRGKISLYRGKECVLKNIDQSKAVEALLQLIEQDKANQAG